MAFWVDRIIINNRAPFQNIDLSFGPKGVTVLTALNGKGKTTILSYIVDAWVELTRRAYSQSYEGKENSYYRVSTPLYDIDQGKPSIVYIRFKNDGVNCDYADIRNKGDQSWYESIIPMQDRIPYPQFAKGTSNKCISTNCENKDLITSIFDNSVNTFFPSYRFELPNYLNEKFKSSEHKIYGEYNGYLKNPLEVSANIEEITNWILDVVLDWDVNKQDVTLADGKRAIINPPEKDVWENVNRVLRGALISKFPGRNIRFGVGRRNNSGSRLAIMEDLNKNESTQYCPSIFNLSSGEISIISIFGELLRQGDRTFGMVPLEQIHGIVLIDEVDKHLHIQLQKESLPMLFALFPNVQFIVSSHSPFLNIGLAENPKTKDCSRIVDLDNNGIESTPISNEVYEEAYQLFLNEKNDYAKKYYAIQKELSEQSRPLLITEGKTDIIHLRNAQKRLGRTDVDVEYAELPDGKWSDAELKKFLINVSKISQGRRVIGMFDRDVPSIVSEIELDGCKYKNYGNNVFAFCIPVPKGRELYQNISIEFFYNDEVVRKEKNGRKLFFNNEVSLLYNKTTNQNLFVKEQYPDASREYQKKIFDEEKMCEQTDYIHSKKTFATLLETDEDFSSEVDYSAFNQIFDIVDTIVKLP